MMKRCRKCGCLLPDAHEDDLCECCRDEYIDSEHEYYDEEESEEINDAYSDL